MNFRKLVQLAIVFLLTTTSCVSPTAYEALLQENEFLTEENNVFREELTFSEDDHLVEGKLEADLVHLQSKLQQAENRYAALEKTYLDLSNKHNIVLREKGSSTNASTYSSDCADELAQIKQDMNLQNTQMRIIEMTLQQKEMQIKDLERLLHGQQFNN